MEYHHRYAYRIDKYGTTIQPILGTIVEWHDEMYIVTKIYRDQNGILHSFQMDLVVLKYDRAILVPENTFRVLYHCGSWYINRHKEEIVITPKDDEFSYVSD